jgi:hypothetical protein
VIQDTRGRKPGEKERTRKIHMVMEVMVVAMAMIDFDRSNCKQKKFLLN